MAQDDSKLNYLGCGVDCRKTRTALLEDLDNVEYKIRELASNDGNIIRNRVLSNETEAMNETTESKKGVEGSVKVTPYRSINLGGELKVKRDSNESKKYRKARHSTRIVTMNKDTSHDPHIVKREGTDPPIHYTQYEKELSQFILEHIETEASTKGGKVAMCLGKMIKDLKGDDSIARLEELLQHARKELRQQTWQTLMDACCSFIKEKPYTHYVRSIKLGALRQELCESQDSNRNTSAGVHGTGFDTVDISGQVGQEVVRNSAFTRNESRGTVQSDGTVTAEEVIEARMEPVSSLINKKSQELKIIMERLLQYYTTPEQGTRLGPFHVSGTASVSHGNEYKIYWRVIGDEIYGTTEASEASTFYVKYDEKESCSIIHNTDLQTQLFVTVQRPFLTECPLKLVSSSEHYFTLLSNNKHLPFPRTEEEWERGSPFFIKLPKVGIGWKKPQRYINVRRIMKEWKKKTKSSELPKHTPASGATLNFNSDHVMKQEIELQTRKSIIEKLEFSTGSSATHEIILNEPGEHEPITTQFHFTPVLVQDGRVRCTISGGPPPPPSQITL